MELPERALRVLLSPLAVGKLLDFLTEGEWSNVREERARSLARAYKAAAAELRTVDAPQRHEAALRFAVLSAPGLHGSAMRHQMALVRPAVEEITERLLPLLAAPEPVEPGVIDTEETGP